MIELFSQSETWISLLVLAAMEIVLGIDNIIFISILAGKLPQEQQSRARNIGLTAAVGVRLLLLTVISWIVGLTAPIFTMGEFAFSWRDLILIGGGLFLVAKATLEIHNKLEGEEGHGRKVIAPSFMAVIGQIMLLDIVFSLDSVITAVGLVQHISIMIIAILISLVAMLLCSRMINEFVNRHPTIKMLALSFLLMIGTILVAEGAHFHVPKGYVYFAMAFSVFVELLNLRMRAKSEATPVRLRSEY